MSDRKPGDAQRRLSFERAVSATIVTDTARISPDGRRVAYSTSEASRAAEHTVGSIWVIDTDGGQPTLLTSGDAHNHSPRWSPDGRFIAFLSDRAERDLPQIYLLTAAGGDARRMTDAPGGVSALDWSPDGTMIAFLARDPQSDADKQRIDAREDWIVADDNERRTGLFVVEIPDDIVHRGPGDLPEAKRVSPSHLHVGGYVDAGFSWAPDSRAFVAMAGPSTRTNARIRSTMYGFSLDGVVTEMGEFEGVTYAPRFSPDGSTLAFIGAEGEIPARWVLQTMSATGGDPTIVASGFEGSFNSFVWLPDGDRLLTGVETFQRHVYLTADLETGTLGNAWKLPDLPGTAASDVSCSADGSRCAYVWEDASSYGDVWVADLGVDARKLTNLNPWVADEELGELREITWTSFDGSDIQGLLLLPVGYLDGDAYPLMTHIHGGPAGAWTHRLYAGWHDWGQFLAQGGYAVFMPNPRGSTGRGVDFLRGIVNTYGETDVQDIMTGIDHLIDIGIADPDRLVVGGWSGGGFLTNTLITQTDRFKAAVSGAGIANWVSFQGTSDIRSVFARYVGAIEDDPEVAWRLSPIRTIRAVRTPTLILCGASDGRVALGQSYELYEGLKAVGVETQLVVYPREPHSIEERKHQLDLLNRVVGWYDRHLGRDVVAATG